VHLRSSAYSAEQSRVHRRRRAAATAHGSARLTVDLDVVYRRTSENIARLVSALAPLQPYLRGAPPGLPFDWSEVTIRKGLNFTLTTKLGALDL